MNFFLNYIMLIDQKNEGWGKREMEKFRNIGFFICSKFTIACIFLYLSKINNYVEDVLNK